MTGKLRDAEGYLASSEGDWINSLPEAPSARQRSIFGINSLSQKTFEV